MAAAAPRGDRTPLLQSPPAPHLALQLGGHDPNTGKGTPTPTTATSTSLPSADKAAALWWSAAACENYELLTNLDTGVGWSGLRLFHFLPRLHAFLWQSAGLVLLIALQVLSAGLILVNAESRGFQSDDWPAISLGVYQVYLFYLLYSMVSHRELYVPKTSQELLQSLFPGPAGRMMVSYNWDSDLVLARKVGALLPGCWIDTERLIPGLDVVETCRAAAARSDVLFMFLSNPYARSANCLAEFQAARAATTTCIVATVNTDERPSPELTRMVAELRAEGHLVLSGEARRKLVAHPARFLLNVLVSHRPATTGLLRRWSPSINDFYAPTALVLTQAHRINLFFIVFAVAPTAISIALPWLGIFDQVRFLVHCINYALQGIYLLFILVLFSAVHGNENVFGRCKEQGLPDIAYLLVILVKLILKAPVRVCVAGALSPATDHGLELLEGVGCLTLVHTADGPQPPFGVVCLDGLSASEVAALDPAQGDRILWTQGSYADLPEGLRARLGTSLMLTEQPGGPNLETILLLVLLRLTKLQSTSHISVGRRRFRRLSIKR